MFNNCKNMFRTVTTTYLIVVVFFPPLPLQSNLTPRPSRRRCFLCLTKPCLWWTTVPTWQSPVGSRWSVTWWQRVELRGWFLWLLCPSPSGPVRWNAPWSTAGYSMTFIQGTNWSASEKENHKTSNYMIERIWQIGRIKPCFPNSLCYLFCWTD